jgi:hypothetical protein
MVLQEVEEQRRKLQVTGNIGLSAAVWRSATFGL